MENEILEVAETRKDVKVFHPGLVISVSTAKTIDNDTQGIKGTPPLVDEIGELRTCPDLIHCFTGSVVALWMHDSKDARQNPMNFGHRNCPLT